MRPDTLEYLHSLAVQIRHARSAYRFSQEELADRAAVHLNTVGIAERAERDLNVLTQTRILAVLGCEEIQLRGDAYRVRFGAEPSSAMRKDIMALQDAYIVRNIGASIRERRIALRLSLGDVARKTGLHRNSVWNCEQGLVIPDGNTVFRLYRALGVSRLVAGDWGITLN